MTAPEPQPTRATAATPGAPLGPLPPCGLTSDQVRAIERDRIGREPEVGLAISGGGIRSATFALGLVQALHRLGLFAAVDYVSTVSGGGYTGAWLYALQRRGQLPHALSLNGDEPRQVRFLRAYSNYLTPQLGLFSGDTWAAVGTVTRNLAITFTLLSLSLLAVLYIPWFIHRTYQSWLGMAAAGGPGLAGLVAIAMVLLVCAITTSAANMARPLADGSWRSDAADWTSRTHVQVLVVLPILVAMAILAAVVDRLPDPPGPFGDEILAGAGYALVWALGLSIAHFAKTLGARRDPAATTGVAPVQGAAGTDWRVALRAWGMITGFGFIAGTIGAAVALNLAPALVWTEYVALRMPLLVLSFVLALTAHIGLAGALLSEETREWWARVAGQVLLGMLLCSALVFIAVYAPAFLTAAIDRIDSTGTLKTLAGLAWGAVTGAGVMAGRSSRTRDTGGSSWLDRAGRIAPTVFVVGYLVLLAQVIDLRRPESPLAALAGMAVLGALAWWLSRRADLNEFSMHALYRNRLVRCYLGASNAARKAHPFHGFDPNDDVPLVDVGRSGPLRPYPLFNAAINLVGGKNLAWQQRKAAAFVFTPDVCGYEYRVDEQNDRGRIDAATPPPAPLLSAYAQTALHRGSPLTVGLAMATSGAAASPNMGYHTSPTLSFLMTVFNVRLGWWLRNPHSVASWTFSRKRLSLVELASELLGLTTADRDFVYLSDGGHFENLGVYELVRRRCPFIIVSDAGQDGAVTFEDLGNAIEKVRADFGIDIDIDVSGIRPAAGYSASHCAVGTIHYEHADRTQAPGTLVYVKASITGDEPTDVRRYASQHPEFPHQSTADQFFSESQFESYRALGYHVGQRVFEVVRVHGGAPVSPVEMFRLLRQRWTPAAPAPDDGIGKYSRAVNAIWDAVRTNGDLAFLDAQVFPEWASLMATGRHEAAAGVDPITPSTGVNYWLPGEERQRRAGFYVCNQMLQLMEDVYIEFRLGDHHDHIDNRGWMNLFRHWSWSGMLCATWAVTAATYDPRFQRFCAEQLDLRPGRVRVPGRHVGRRLPDHATWSQWPAERRAEERQAWQASPLGLNFWEAELVAAFLDQVATDTPLTLHPIRVMVESPRRDDGHPFAFTAGYFILAHVTDDDATLVHVRVQNHLRKMGVAGTALRELMRPAPEGWGLRRLEVRIADEDAPAQTVALDEALPRREVAKRVERWIAAFAPDQRRAV
jgi:hypothetical protein